MATQRTGQGTGRWFVVGVDFRLVCLFVGGLVRRGGRGATSGETDQQNEATGWGSPVSDRDLDKPDQDEGYEDKAEDSKAVRLTLMEEVLLLGIKDREVNCLRAWPVRNSLALFGLKGYNYHEGV